MYEQKKSNQSNEKVAKNYFGQMKFFVFYCLVLLCIVGIVANLYVNSNIESLNGASADKQCIVVDLNLDNEKNTIDENELANLKIQCLVSTSSRKVSLKPITNDFTDFAWENSGYSYYYVVSANWGNMSINLELLKESCEKFNSTSRRFKRFDITLPSLTENLTQFSCGATQLLCYDETNDSNYYGMLVNVVWEDATKIIIDNNGGIGDDSISLFLNEVPSQKLSIPTKDNCEFLGYYAGETKYVNADGTFVNDIAIYQSLPTTLLSKWKSNSSPSYVIDLLNEEENVGQIVVENGVVVSGVITPPIKVGYNFLGFYCENNSTSTRYIDENGNIDTTASLYVNQIHSLFAQYELITYTITYLNLDGSILETNNLSNPTTYNVESDEIILLAPMSPNGVEFVGWSTDKVNVTPNFTLTKGSIGDVVVYAHFNSLTFRVNFVGVIYGNIADLILYVYLDNKIYCNYSSSSSNFSIILPKANEGNYKLKFLFTNNSVLKVNSTENILSKTNRSVILNDCVDTTIHYTLSLTSHGNHILV